MVAVMKHGISGEIEYHSRSKNQENTFNIRITVSIRRDGHYSYSGRHQSRYDDLNRWVDGKISEKTSNDKISGINVHSGPIPAE